MVNQPSSSDDAGVDVLLDLPDANRGAFKAPLGPISTDPDEVGREAGRPLIAVGDIVTADLVEHGYVPDLSVVDGRTKRRPVTTAVANRLEDLDRTIEAVNPAGVITRSLVAAVMDGLDRPGPVKLVVDGEEDLAVIPAILAAPHGATVVYGQPDEGIVVVNIDRAVHEHVTDLLACFEGDVRAVFDLVEST